MSPDETLFRLSGGLSNRLIDDPVAMNFLHVDVIMPVKDDVDAIVHEHPVPTEARLSAKEHFFRGAIAAGDAAAARRDDCRIHVASRELLLTGVYNRCGDSIR